MVPLAIACKPIVALLAIVEFRTMTLTAVSPFAVALMPTLLLALTQSLTVAFITWVSVRNSSPSAALFSTSTCSKTPFVVPVPLGAIRYYHYPTPGCSTQKPASGST
jgi:hypothetical protein